MLAKEVTLLTGFLGTGKTTLLNAIIKLNKDIRYAIIENERETRIVFIGRKLKVHGFERMLRNCLDFSSCT